MLGGGAGSIQHMIVTLRNNKNLLRRINKFKQQSHNKVRHSEHIELEFKQFTEEELEEFRQHLKKTIRIQKFKNGMVLAFTLLVAAFFIILFYKNVVFGD